MAGDRSKYSRWNKWAQGTIESCLVRPTKNRRNYFNNRRLVSYYGNQLGYLKSGVLNNRTSGKTSLYRKIHHIPNKLAEYRLSGLYGILSLTEALPEDLPEPEQTYLPEIREEVERASTCTVLNPCGSWLCSACNNLYANISLANQYRSKILNCNEVEVDPSILQPSETSPTLGTPNVVEAYVMDHRLEGIERGRACSLTVVMESVEHHGSEGFANLDGIRQEYERNLERCQDLVDHIVDETGCLVIWSPEVCLSNITRKQFDEGDDTVKARYHMHALVIFRDGRWYPSDVEKLVRKHGNFVSVKAKRLDKNKLIPTVSGGPADRTSQSFGALFYMLKPHCCVKRDRYDESRFHAAMAFFLNTRFPKRYNIDGDVGMFTRTDDEAREIVVGKLQVLHSPLRRTDAEVAEIRTSVMALKNRAKEAGISNESFEKMIDNAARDTREDLLYQEYSGDDIDVSEYRHLRDRAMDMIRKVEYLKDRLESLKSRLEQGDTSVKPLVGDLRKKIGSLNRKKSEMFREQKVIHRIIRVRSMDPVALFCHHLTRYIVRYHSRQCLLVDPEDIKAVRKRRCVERVGYSIPEDRMDDASDLIMIIGSVKCKTTGGKLTRFIEDLVNLWSFYSYDEFTEYARTGRVEKRLFDGGRIVHPDVNRDAVRNFCKYHRNQTSETGPVTILSAIAAALEGKSEYGTINAMYDSFVVSGNDDLADRDMAVEMA